MAFADRLDQLVRAAVAPGGRRWTNISLAEALTKAGVATSDSYVSLLRKGKRGNPSDDVVAGLAQLLGTTPGYLRYGENPDAATDLDQSYVDRGVQEIALRSTGLSDRSKELLLNVIDNLRAAEGLPPPNTPQEDDP